MFDGKFNVGMTQIPGFQEEPACAQMCPNLTFKQRVMGFAACAGIGWLLSFIGTLTLIGGPTAKNITSFAILYVMGNITALCATGFLLGPRSQCRQMWHPTRRYTTALYLALLIIVFSIALAKVNVGVVIVMLLLQMCVAFWYSISYIPFGRKIVLSFMRQVPCFKPCFEAYDQAMASRGNNEGDAEEGGMGSTIKKGFSQISRGEK